MRSLCFTVLLTITAFLPHAVYAQQACTEIGCLNGLTLTVDPARKWERGQYDLFFMIDGRQITCRGELPLHDCEHSPTFTCNRPGVTITESGCALPQSQQSVGDIHIEGDPRKILVRITRNYKPLLTRTIAAQYNESRPNGPGCGPVCKSASYDLFSAMDAPR